MRRKPGTRGHAGRAYGAGVGLGVGNGVIDPEGLAEADAEADADPDADADPLGTGVVLGVGMGVGEGKRELGTFASERANMSTKMTITIVTQMRAKLSLRGGSEPR